ncbi:MAG: glycosyltransferase family 2 protein [Cohaesibacteraceae bacterium]|nr:glycosyltransferase family 2 protein [Cohaesibacteraceae bacterium]MBL4876538.1 glycosyltransferase family 2 protein [Cohaesibacteraceae bacterium]
MKTTSPLLTIALPVFNGGNTLQVAIQSILDQTFQDWELLVIDDGSSDGMVEKLDFSLDHRIRIISDGTNKGLSYRLNQAVNVARGIYFARMDHDDISHPQRFEKQITYLQSREDIDLLGTYCITLNEHSQITGRLPLSKTHKNICKRPWLGFYIPHPTWCGKTEWFRQNKYKQNPAPYCCEDQELLLRTHTHSKFEVLPLYLLAYRKTNRFNFRRVFKTRWANLKFKTKFFSKNRQYDKLLLVLVLFITIIPYDGLIKLFGRSRLANLNNQPSLIKWEFIIRNLV